MESCVNHGGLCAYRNDCSWCCKALSEHLGRLCLHLDHYSWVHKFKVNSILLSGAINEIPETWKSGFLSMSVDELNALPKGNVDKASKDLLAFIQSSINVCLPYRQYTEFPMRATPSIPMGRYMTPKKSHEVEQMSSMVAELCNKYNCSCVIDLGAGLGYVDRILDQKHGIKVLAVEKESKHIKSSSDKKFLDNVDILLLTLQDNSECWSTLSSKVSEFCKSGDAGLIGLHCCGDLSVFMMKLFNSMGCIKFMLCASCCYHKMNYSVNKFDNFPLSQSLQEICKQFDKEFLNVYSLRLGCQETPARWFVQSELDHLHHQRCMQWGCLIEWLKEKEGVKLTKCSKNLKSLNNSSSIEEFVGAFSSCYKVNCYSESVASEDQVRTLLQKAYSENQDSLNYLEFMTALQVIIQPVIESLIVLDRVKYLLETNDSFVEVKVIPLFDEFISPRNLGLLAVR